MFSLRLNPTAKSVADLIQVLASGGKEKLYSHLLPRNNEPPARH